MPESVPDRRHSPWFRRSAERPDASVRLLCLPHAGGNASTFYDLSRALAPSIEVLLLTPPGRLARLAEPVPDRVADAADAVAAALGPWRDRPLALYGHSYGALLAYEVACRLCRSGAVPLCHLLVSGFRAPHRPMSLAPLHGLAGSALFDRLAERFGGPSLNQLGPEMAALLEPALCGDITACETYRHPGWPALDVPVTLFQGADDHTVTLDEVSAWRELATGRFAMETFPGDHFFIKAQTEPLARAIERALGGGMMAS